MTRIPGISGTIGLDERIVDRRFGMVMQWLARVSNLRLGLDQTFSSLVEEKEHIVDDGTRKL